jgi:competence protein ComK
MKGSIFVKELDQYCIVHKTIMILPAFDEFGHLYSHAFEGMDVFYVKQSPLHIINDSLLQYGCDLKGAQNAAKHHLGNKNMLPIKISSSKDIYWFPHKSPKSLDCTWFAVHHILDARTINKNKTEVVLNFGHTIELDLKEKYLKEKIQRTRELKRKIEEPDKMRLFYYDSHVGFQIVKDSQNIHYKIKNRKER